MTYPPTDAAIAVFTWFPLMAWCKLGVVIGEMFDRTSSSNVILCWSATRPTAWRTLACCFCACLFSRLKVLTGSTNLPTSWPAFLAALLALLALFRLAFLLSGSIGFPRRSFCFNRSSFPANDSAGRCTSCVYCRVHVCV